MPESYPTVLPNPSARYSFDAEGSVVSTALDGGTLRQRQRFSTQFDVVDVSWDFTDFELSLFRSWLKNKVAGGADAFNIDLPLADGWGFSTFLVKLVSGSLRVRHRSVLSWLATARLYVLNPALMAEATYDWWLSDPTALYTLLHVDMVGGGQYEFYQAISATDESGMLALEALLPQMAGGQTYDLNL